MQFSFLTPLGALFVLAGGALVFLAYLAERRVRTVRQALGLQAEASRSTVEATALMAVTALLALSLMQPVLRTTETHRVRTDAEAYFVLDVSRSMLGAQSPTASTRIERAARVALRMRTALASVPSGLASMTDRVVPHVFPTDDEEVFAAALAQTMRVNNPPPRGFEEIGTLFESLDALPGPNLYSVSAKTRLAVVLTDGESQEYYVPTLRAALTRRPRVQFVIVRLGKPSDRVWIGENPDSRYRGQPDAPRLVDQLARLTGGRAFTEGDVGAAIGAARQMVGSGPTESRGDTLRVISLSRWCALAAVAPLAFFLWRRRVL